MQSIFYQVYRVNVQSPGAIKIIIGECFLGVLLESAYLLFAAGLFAFNLNAVTCGLLCFPDLKPALEVRA